MPIPETQLETWSHVGSVTQSKATYHTIKNTLEASDTAFAGRSSVFLQGSYGNDTNVWAESDVDIVICLDSSWYSDQSALSPAERTACDAAFPNATYSYSDFKRDVHSVLTKKYGSAVTTGDKAFCIAAGAGRRKADVIAAVQFRRYLKFNGINDQSYVEGICFWNAAGRRIANYPRQHSDNLTRKHQDSRKWLKPLIRVFKNLRSYCVEQKTLGAGIAPSYYLEGLLYNVPSDRFHTSYQDCFISAVNWIQTESNKTELLCANEQYYLLRDGVPTCWPPAHAEAFLSAAIQTWNDW